MLGTEACTFQVKHWQKSEASLRASILSLEVMMDINKKISRRLKTETPSDNQKSGSGKGFRRGGLPFVQKCSTLNTAPASL
jgi:hypothetical protein